MKAIFFGSIGSLVETSELQRASFNAAFEEAGLGWHWDQASYRDMLRKAGGQDRISEYAKARNEAVDAQALHVRKSALFQDALAQGQSLRPGVAATLEQARLAGVRLGFVTSTERHTVEIISRLVAEATSAVFDVTTWRQSHLPGKPDPAVYNEAVHASGLNPSDVVAIEDNRDGVLAAKAAGLYTIGFPGENTLSRDLHAADDVVVSLENVSAILPATKNAAAA